MSDTLTAAETRLDSALAEWHIPTVMAVSLDGYPMDGVTFPDPTNPLRLSVDEWGTRVRVASMPVIIGLAPHSLRLTPSALAQDLVSLTDDAHDGAYLEWYIAIHVRRALLALRGINITV